MNETTPRRLRAVDVIDKLLERNHQSRQPSVSLKRSVAPGRQGIVEIDVDVPVCEQFPTLEQATAAAKRVYAELDALYPVPETVTK